MWPCVNIFGCTSLALCLLAYLTKHCISLPWTSLTIFALDKLSVTTIASSQAGESKGLAKYKQEPETESENTFSWEDKQGSTILHIVEVSRCFSPRKVYFSTNWCKSSEHKEGCTILNKKIYVARSINNIRNKNNNDEQDNATNDSVVSINNDNNVSVVSSKTTTMTTRQWHKILCRVNQRLVLDASQPFMSR